MNKIAVALCTFCIIYAEGKIGGVTYFDYTYAEEKSSFNFNRQYFSYGVNVSDDVSFKVIFDVGRTNKGDVVYINNMEMLKYVFKKGCKLDDNCCFYAARNHNLKMLKSFAIIDVTHLAPSIGFAVGESFPEFYEFFTVPDFFKILIV